MDQDDRPIGRVLNRREALVVIGTVAAAALAACQPAPTESEQPTGAPVQAATSSPGSAAQASTASPTQAAAAATSTTSTGALPVCVARPALTEGPYFVDEGLNRSDIRSDPSDGSVREGAPLQLVFRVSRIDGSTCAPLEGVTVDVWHCDAQGVYSDVQDPGFNTQGQQFLRGYQVTDASGSAAFTTIYPGWYQGRAVHIHFKLRTDPDSDAGYEFTSQLFFDEALTDQVHAQEPYASKGYRTLLNEGDGIFQQAGDQLILAVSQEGDGYVGVFDVGLQMA